MKKLILILLIPFVVYSQTPQKHTAQDHTSIYKSFFSDSSLTPVLSRKPIYTIGDSLWWETVTGRALLGVAGTVIGSVGGWTDIGVAVILTTPTDSVGMGVASASVFTIKDTLIIEGGIDDSPKLVFVPFSGPAWSLFTKDSDDNFKIETNTSSADTVDIVNIGSGVANLTVEGAVVFGKTTITGLIEDTTPTSGDFFISYEAASDSIRKVEYDAIRGDSSFVFLTADTLVVFDSLGTIRARIQTLFLGQALLIDGGPDDSPKMSFVPFDGTAWKLFTKDADDNFQIQSDATASTETINISNPGAGVADVTIDGRLGIGITVPEGPLHIVNDGAATGNILLDKYSPGSEADELDFRKARGSVATPSVVLVNDDLGGWLARGYDGTSFVLAARVQPEVDGTVSTGIVPGRIRFLTTNTSGVLTERMRIDNAGNVGIGITPAEKLHLKDAGATKLRIEHGAAQFGQVLFYEDATAEAFVGYISPTFSDAARRDALEIATNKAGVGFISFRINVQGEVARFDPVNGFLGLQTTLPTSELSFGTDAVITRATVDASDTGFLILAGAGAALHTRGAHIVVYGNEHATDDNKGAIKIIAAKGDDATNLGDIQFITGTAATEKMRITDAGFVSIGAGSSPTDKLDVEGGRSYLSALDAAPADGQFAVSQWSIYFDEAADGVFIKWKESGGTTFTKDIGAGAGGGEANTFSSLGGTETIIGTKTGVDLPHKGLTAGSNITLTPTANDITIASTGGGTGAFSDAGDPVVLNTTTKDVVIGGGAILDGAKFSIDGDSDQRQVIIQGFSPQTNPIFTVENSVGTDLFVVNDNGFAGLGITGTTSLLHLSLDGQPTIRIDGYSNTAAEDPQLLFTRFRGTFSSKLAVQDNDPIGDIVFRGYSGTGNRKAATIHVEVDGTVTGSNVPGAMSFRTDDTERMRIDGVGNVVIGAVVADRLFHVEESTALTSTVQDVLRLTHITSGTPAAGIGLGIEGEVETAAGNNEIGGVIELVTTDVTAANEDFDWVFFLMAAGLTPTEAVRFTSTGNITLTGTVDGVDIAARDHDAVTVSGTPDYITLSGQDIIRAQIDLVTDVTGVLPDANIPDHTGDVTGGTALTIAVNVVGNTKLSDMVAYTIKLRNAGTTGDPGDVKISALTEEVSPAALDFILGEIASGELRKFDVGNLPAGGSSEWTQAALILHPNVSATEEVAVGGTTEALADIFLGADGDLFVNKQAQAAGDFQISTVAQASVMFVDASANMVVFGSQVDIGGLVNIDGNLDEVQFKIQGHSTQINSIMVIEESGGANIMSFTQIAGGARQQLGANGFDGILRLFSEEAGGDATIDITVPADVTSTGDSYTLVLPVDEGSSGFVLTTDGADPAITSWTAAGVGDITAVGPMYATGEAFIDGTITAGTEFLVIEGTASNTFEYHFNVTSASPASDFTFTFPDATGEVSLLGQTIDLTSEIIGTLPEVDGGTGDTDLDDMIGGTAITVTDGANTIIAGNATIAVTADGITATEVATDAINLLELDDGADTPLATEFLVVATGATDVEYLTQQQVADNLEDNIDHDNLLNFVANEHINGDDKSITIEDPVATDDIGMFFSNRAITVTEMRIVVRGASPSTTVDIRHSTDRSAAGAALITSPSATTSQSTGSDITSFDDATIVADSFIWVEFDAVSGTVDEVSITIFFTYD